MIKALLNGQQSRQHPAVIECFNLKISRKYMNLIIITTPAFELLVTYLEQHVGVILMTKD